MKEYWVNVYNFNICGGKYCNIEECMYSVMSDVYYRLHVREFDTREAKELYLRYRDMVKFSDKGMFT